MLFTIIPLYALLAALIWLTLWFRVTAYRGATGQSIGDGNDPQLLLRIRHHGNCADWCAFALILLILAEGMSAPAIALHIAGILLIIGRIAHPFGLKIDNAGHPLRYAGNGTNILAVFIAMGPIIIKNTGL